MQKFFEYGNPRFDGRHIEDCYIRATVFATKKPYDEVEMLFQQKQIKLQTDMPNRPLVIEAVMRDMDYSFVETINPKTGMGNVRISTFLKNNKGRYILKSKGHLCYAENGKILDTWDSSQKLLMGYWIVK